MRRKDEKERGEGNGEEGDQAQKKLKIKQTMQEIQMFH